MRILLRIGIAATLLLTGVGSILAQDRPNRRSVTLGISLGSDAYLADMTDAGAMATDTSVLVAPGTPLLVFGGTRGKGRGRTLALSELGVWLYIPTDAGNLVGQSSLLYTLRDRLSTGREWRAFGQKVRVSDLPCVAFTQGELVPVSHDPTSGTFTAHLSKDDPRLAEKFTQVKDACPDIPSSKVDLVLSTDDAFGHVDITKSLRESISQYLNEPELAAFSYGSGSDFLFRQFVEHLYEEWPKMISLGTILSYGCNIDSVNEVRTREEELERKLSATIDSAFKFLDIGVGFERTAVDRISLQLQQSYRTGVSVADAAALYIQGAGGSYVTFGEVASCKKIEGVNYIAKSPPYWHRMHWEGSNPFLADFPQYQSAADAGLNWNKDRGFIELECFSRDYKKLDSILQRVMPERQAHIFMLQYARPTEGRWKDVYSCGSS